MPVALSSHHVTAGLIESVNLLRSQVASDLAEVPDDLLNEWLRLARLERNKVAPARLGNLDESIAGHVLDTLVRLVHELKQLVDDRLEELPMRLEEAGILADNVHDVGGDDGLVILAALHLSKSKKILDNGNKEPLLRLLVHGQGDGTNGPAENVAVVP